MDTVNEFSDEASLELEEQIDTRQFAIDLSDPDENQPYFRRFQKFITWIPLIILVDFLTTLLMKDEYDFVSFFF